jgi:uncharacterized C2H2 Zn-finger protein
MTDTQLSNILDTAQRACPKCGKQYSRRDSMLRHVSLAHGSM